MSRDSLRPLLSAASTALAGLIPMIAQAQQNVADEEPPPPEQVSDVLGSWWAKLYEPEFLHRVVLAATEVLTVVIITVIIYVGVMLLFARAVARLEHDTEQAVQPDRRRKQRVVTVLELMRSVARWVILVTGVVWVLAAAGMDIRPVLAGAGVLGLAVGFGAQNLVRDLVSGFFILLEGQYAVGDYVQISGNFGMVESIGIRVTVLRDLDNQRHYLPNGAIAVVTVYEQPFVNYIIETPLADSEHAARAAQIVTDLAAALKREYPRHLVYHGAIERARVDGHAVIRLPVAIFPTQEWLANEEIPAAIRDALVTAEIPLREGRAIRTYLDLTHMPQYHYSEATGEGEVV